MHNSFISHYVHRLKNGPRFPFAHEHVLGLVNLGGDVMAPAAIRVVGYHYPLMGLLYLVQRSTLSGTTVGDL
jgi:hypothetical protein